MTYKTRAETINTKELLWTCQKRTFVLVVVQVIRHKPTALLVTVAEQILLPSFIVLPLGVLDTYSYSPSIIKGSDLASSTSLLPSCPSLAPPQEKQKRALSLNFKLYYFSSEKSCCVSLALPTAVSVQNWRSCCGWQEIILSHHSELVGTR